MNFLKAITPNKIPTTHTSLKLDSLALQWTKIVNAISCIPNVRHVYTSNSILLQINGQDILSLPLIQLPLLRSLSFDKPIISYTFYDPEFNSFRMNAFSQTSKIFDCSFKLKPFQLNQKEVESHNMICSLLIAHTVGINKLILNHPYSYPYYVCNGTLKPVSQRNINNASVIIELIKLFKGFDMQLLETTLIESQIESNLLEIK